METFGVGAVLNYGGYWLGSLTIVLLGIAAGFIGNYLARREKKKEKKGYIYFSCVFIFFWLYICGWSFFVDSSWFGAVICGLLVVASSVSVSVLCFDNSGGFPGFLVGGKNGNYTVQIIVYVLATIIFIGMLFSLSGFMADSPDFIRLTEKQRADRFLTEYILNEDIGISKDDVEEAIKAIADYGLEISPYELGIANVRLEKYKDASDQFGRYALSQKNDTDRAFWNGISYYWRGNSVLAAEQFQVAGAYDLAILAFYADDNLDREKFSRLMRGLKIKADSRTNALIKNIEKTLAHPVTPQPAVKNTDMRILLERISKLEQMLAQNKGNKSGVDSGELRKQIPIVVINRILSLNKHIPLSDDKSAGTFIFLVSSFFVFLVTMFSTNLIISKGYFAKLKKVAAIKHVMLIFALVDGNILLKYSWHSSFARKIALKIAKAEKEKGMFQAEISRVHQAFFPFDAVVALRFLAKAKGIAKKWEISAAEREEARQIYQEIRILSGKLIPHGGEDALSVIMALRDKGTDIFNRHCKEQLLYEAAREQLLGALSELATVGDILEARKSQITFYDLLGVPKKTDGNDIKTAYRAIISVIHPDLHQGNKYLQLLTVLVNNAYAALSRPDRRKAYDITMQF